MSQQALADAMRTHGHKWSQATVWGVEKGERPMRFREALDVATILELDVTDLIEGSDVRHHLSANLRMLRQYWEEARHGVVKTRVARGVVHRMVDDLLEGDPLREEALQVLDETPLDETLLAEEPRG